MLATVEPGTLATALPREFYTSEAIYQQELEKVFNRQWHLIGNMGSLQKPGDYFVKQLGPESIIVALDKEGTLRAYFNVCRHRGYQMLENGSTGCAEGIVCPYHKWTYDMGGALRRVPGTKDGRDFDFGDWPLHEASVDQWHGWIHVWLGKDTPPSLESVLGPVSDAAALQMVNSVPSKVAHRETYVINANWKAMMENDMECYHCGHGGHPSLALSCNYQSFYADAEKIEGQYFPLRDGMATLSMDGKRVCKKPLGAPQSDSFSTGFLQWPFFSGVAIFVDHAITFELSPLGVDRAQFICDWYVNDEAVEGVDYDVDTLIEIFHKTNLEDVAFGETNYRGILSSRFVPGPLHPRREDGVIAAYNLYREKMAAD